jgi:Amt family ammonium transporter
MATAILVAVCYPLIEGVYWNGNYGLQDTVFKKMFGAPFKDFAGSIVVHAFGGWVALWAILMLGPRLGRYGNGHSGATPPSSIPWLALGSWLLCIGWFCFNVMSAQKLEAISGLVALNSLMAMSGGIVVALIVGDNDPGFVHNGALAGLVAVCAGSDVMHPIGSLIVGGVAGAIFVVMFQVSTNKWKIDDVLGVWALHGLCGLWGGIACGIFGLEVLGGLGGVTFASQLVGSLAGAAFGFVVGIVVYGLLRVTVGIRLAPDDERRGADLTIHNIRSNPEEDMRMGV